MNYKYKSFSFICFALSVVTKEVTTTESNDNSIELFDNILYQRINEIGENIKDIYFAWSIIKQLIETNKAFLYRPYEEVIDNTLHGDTEYELADNFIADLLKGLSNLVGQNKRLFDSFYKIGADKCLDDLMINSN